MTRRPPDRAPTESPQVIHVSFVDSFNPAERSLRGRLVAAAQLEFACLNGRNCLLTLHIKMRHLVSGHDHGRDTLDRLAMSWSRNHSDHLPVQADDSLIVPCRPEDSKELKARLTALITSRQSALSRVRTINLRQGAMARWSLFHVCYFEGEVIFSLNGAAWRKLRSAIRTAARSKNDAELAVGAAIGRWLADVAPALMHMDVEPIRDLVLETLRLAQVKESLDLQAFRTTWFKSICAWLRVRDQAST